MERSFENRKWYGEVQHLPFDRIWTLLYVIATLVFIFVYAY